LRTHSSSSSSSSSSSWVRLSACYRSATSVAVVCTICDRKPVVWRNSFVEATELKRMSSRSGGLVSPALMAQLEQLEAAQSASAVSRAWARALDGSFRVLELLGHPRLHISVRDSVACAHTPVQARHGTARTPPSSIMPLCALLVTADLTLCAPGARPIVAMATDVEHDHCTVHSDYRCASADTGAAYAHRTHARACTPGVAVAGSRGRHAPKRLAVPSADRSSVVSVGAGDCLRHL
jgi:hypothetical protein